MALLVIYEKLNHKRVHVSGLAGRGVARDGLLALPLRILLENAKNGSAAMVAHAGCRVCQSVGLETHTSLMVTSTLCYDSGFVDLHVADSLSVTLQGSNPVVSLNTDLESH